MNDTHHQGSVRCSCWHSTNPRIILSGGDDRTIRLWRLYPHNSLYQSSNNNNNNNNKQESNISTPQESNKENNESSKMKSTSENESEDSVELRYDELSGQQLSDDDDPNKFITDFDPSIQPMSHLLSMPASGEVKALCMSPYNGEILVATSSRLFNQKSSLDILNIPHWTWNYSSNKRLPYRKQLAEKILKQKTKTNIISQNKTDNNSNLYQLNSLDDELKKEDDSSNNNIKNNPFIENQKYILTETLDFINRPSVIPLPYGARERCITFSPSPHIVFVGLLSCRKKHQRRYCCLMACNILNGASRACKKVNALLHRKECIYSIQLTSTNNNEKKEEEKKEYEDNNNNNKSIYRLALGTNLGRLIIVTLKEDLSWINTRKSFINEYTIGYKQDPVINGNLIINNNNNNNMNNINNNNINNNNNNNNNNNSNSKLIKNKTKTKTKNKHHRKTSSKYSVLTARERIFREMADPITVMITYESMKKYLWNESSQIDETDINEFFTFMKPNKKNQITFTQFVQKIDEDGNFMRAFEQFCLTGSSRTDRRAWMDNNDSESESDMDNNNNEPESDDSDWELSMLNNRASNPEILTDLSAITAIAWSKYDLWIITGHQDGDIQFWSREYYSDINYKLIAQNKYIIASQFYYVNRGSMRRHLDSITCLTLSGTYLVSSSCDGNILIWHLDFLLPSVTLPINITLRSKGIIQLLATISSAHLGDEICDVKLSSFNNNISYCIPNALYLLSCGGDENIRCRDVMEILRQQLTLRILAESNQDLQNKNHENNNIINHNQNNKNNQNNNNQTSFPKYDTYTAMNRTKSIIHNDKSIIGINSINDNSDDGSDFGATEYNY